MKLSRRDMLKISGSAAVALAACGNETIAEPSSETIDTRSSQGPQSADGAIVFRDGAELAELTEAVDLFPLGVAAGDVQEDRVVLWTRYYGQDPVTLHVWEEGGEGRFVWQSPTLFREGFGHAAVTGLAPGRRYSYAFSAGNPRVRSQVGRFRAAIDSESLEPVSFLGFSCTHYRREPFPALSFAALEPDIDFWVSGGDKVYCDQLDGLQSAYRASYERIYRQPGMRALHAAGSTYGVWDDHEFENNFDPETTDPEVIALAKHTFFEHNPFERPVDDRIWHSVRWGKTLELFLLDCRAERQPSQDVYMSRAQMDWLKGALAASPCTFKFIVNQVPIADFPLVFDFKSYDRWGGYPEQREEILSHIADSGISDVWWLSGDFHLGAIGLVEKTGPYSNQRELIWGPGGQRANPLHFILDAPQWDFATGDSNYFVLRCDPIAHTVRVSVVNDRGRTLFDKTY